VTAPLAVGTTFVACIPMNVVRVSQLTYYGRIKGYPYYLGMGAVIGSVSGQLLVEHIPGSIVICLVGLVAIYVGVKTVRTQVQARSAKEPPASQAGQEGQSGAVEFASAARADELDTSPFSPNDLIVEVPLPMRGYERTRLASTKSTTACCLPLCGLVGGGELHFPAPTSSRASAPCAQKVGRGANAELSIVPRSTEDEEQPKKKAGLVRKGTGYVHAGEVPASEDEEEEEGEEAAKTAVADKAQEMAPGDSDIPRVHQVLVGLIASTLSSLTGTGGPLVFLPLYYYLQPKADAKTVAGISSCFSSTLVLTSAVTALSQGDVDLGIALGFSPVAIVFAFLGGMLQERADSAQLKRAIGVILILIGCTVVVRTVVSLLDM